MELREGEIRIECEHCKKKLNTTVRDTTLVCPCCAGVIQAPSSKAPDGE
jgi:hypothetical protein